MKTVVVFLVVIFGGLQTISVTDCCCIEARERPLKRTPKCHGCDGPTQQFQSLPIEDSCRQREFAGFDVGGAGMRTRAAVSGRCHAYSTGRGDSARAIRPASGGGLSAEVRRNLP